MSRISTNYDGQPFKILDARLRIVGWTRAPFEEVHDEMRAVNGCHYRHVRNRKTGDR